METTETTNVEIGEVIDSRPIGRLQVLVIVLCALVIFLDGYDIQVMALVVPSIAAEWGLDSARFSFALSAAIAGIGVGGALIAPFGDRWGRRPLIITSLLIVGVTTLGTTTATTPLELVVWRLLAGLALGASIPNAIALTAEYVPARRRAALVALMYCSIALGAFAAGFIAPPLIEAFGWKATFVVGGGGPLILAVLIFAAVPESLNFLLVRPSAIQRARRILRRLAPEIEAAHVYADPPKTEERQSVMALLAPGYRVRTTLLWCIFCLNLLVLYFLVSWLPTLLTEAGWPRAEALQGAVLIQAGGIAGGLFLAWLVDRGHTARALAAAYIVTTLCFGLFMLLPSTFVSWGLLLIVVGGGVSGGQLAITALAAVFYPPFLRATGVGWATAVGRVGAVGGPLLGGWIAYFGLETFEVLGLLMIPMVTAAACALLVRRDWTEPAPTKTET